MTLASTAALVAAATSRQTALFAFNVITIEHAEGIAEGAERTGDAVLLQVSENTVAFHGGRIAPLVSACARVAEASAVPIAVHLDHFQDPGLLGEAIDTATRLGVSSVMIDAAHLPYRDNVERTRSFVRSAHQAGLWVEAELGAIGGKEPGAQSGTVSAHTAGVRTDPAEAAVFAEQTGVDGLAVAVGNSHAMTTRDTRLDIDLIRQLAAHVPIPLVLHGSSGVSDDQLRAAVAAGMRKINVGTALNVGYTAALRQALSADTSGVDPRPYLSAGRQAVADTVAALCANTAPQLLGAGERDAR
ncbi:ketose-bisphosphate aldolase [Mycolicibacterium canariasense]|uniref:Ketose-bisphosphate aldolase n=1 Tax=Mycolicibacterium canariasense TaxID=228230 RepID=A0A100WJN7_MYCCR|nr:class II fructose-bisphosphate aldolase [Mycolicibacterium canariasense]MCV7208112.1 class II fructose-bisphosphate aldolase [Mycolicibacterium canariasense]ORV09542.1 fructose-bisphosphate aldolase [Mycolicibacterium canariasense]GAS99144.1 ketose-bisphosphate aldolase [Mycolicibacterium canariasense]